MCNIYDPNGLFFDSWPSKFDWCNIQRVDSGHLTQLNPIDPTTAGLILQATDISSITNPQQARDSSSHWFKVYYVSHWMTELLISLDLMMMMMMILVCSIFWIKSGGRQIHGTRDAAALGCPGAGLREMPISLTKSSAFLTGRIIGRSHKMREFSGKITMTMTNLIMN